MMRSVHLYGKLKKQFGPKFRFDVATAAEALRALNCAFPGNFVEALQTGSYRLVRGDRHTGMSLDIGLVNAFGLGSADLHIIPVAKGASNGKGVGKTILGAALIGGAIFLSGGTLAAPLSSLSAPIVSGVGITWGNIAAIGLGTMLMGASTLLSKTEAPNASDQETSFTTSGPSSTAKQGSAIPLIYGRCMTSPVTISVDADIEDIGAYQGVVGPLS